MKEAKSREKGEERLGEVVVRSRGVRVALEWFSRSFSVIRGYRSEE